MSRQDVTIESLLFPTEHAYCVHADHMALWDQYYRTQHPLTSGSVGHFRTYGDGLTRHSGESVTTEYLLEDFCLSAAGYLLRTVNPGFDSGQLDMWEREGTTGMKFIAGLTRSTTGKRRWYSLSEEKIGSGDKLRHDKRYVEFPGDIDGGTLKDCVNLYWLASDPNAGRPLLRRLKVIFDFAEILNASHSAIEDATGLNCEGRDVVTAFRTLRHAFAFVRERERAMHLTDICVQAHARRQKVAAQPETTQAAA